MPIKILPIAGDEAVKAEIEAAIEEAQGLIFAFDSDKQFLPPTALDVFLPPGGGTQVKHVSLMSRYLNGAGMGFFPSAAKAGANAEIWNGDAKSIEAYREMEKAVGVRVRDLGATCTTIRAGTLKGGASGERSSGGEGGEPSFLNPAFCRSRGSRTSPCPPRPPPPLPASPSALSPASPSAFLPCSCLRASRLTPMGNGRYLWAAGRIQLVRFQLACARSLCVMIVACDTRCVIDSATTRSLTLLSASLRTLRRLLYDCGVLEVELVKGDTLPGPGFTAALTAISPEGGQGDSHRGAVATALVEAMRCAAAADADFSVRSTPGRQFPQEGAWEALFAKA